jgi:hypothetical protein
LHHLRGKRYSGVRFGIRGSTLAVQGDLRAIDLGEVVKRGVMCCGHSRSADPLFALRFVDRHELPTSGPIERTLDKVRRGAFGQFNGKPKRCFKMFDHRRAFLRAVRHAKSPS